MKYQYALVSDVGRRRQQNQDNGAAVPDLGLFLVADGMGGHQGGETASAMAADLIPAHLASHMNSETAPKQLITKAIESASRTIFELAAHTASLHGMGTTTTALLFHSQKLWIGHVGDSRCYFVRPDAIWQLTQDHSLVAERVRAGLLSREQATTFAQKNVITRSVGFEENVKVDTYEMEPQEGDLFMICSDGLTGHVSDREILEIIKRHCFDDGEMKAGAEALINRANERGGEDNITALIVQLV